MPQKTIAIYFSDPELMGYPFHKQEYFDIYKEVIKKIESHGIAAYIVRGDSYQGAGVFSHGSRFEGGTLKPVVEKIKAGLIFNRDDKNTIPTIYDCPIINHPDFDALCVDKLKTAEMFPELSPRTSAVTSAQEAKKIAAVWGVQSDEKIVLKLNFETEGRGIYVLPLGEVTENLYPAWNNIIMQKFLDSSVGIPGLTNDLHDLRVTVVNGEPINSFLRIPKKGSFLANISQGGSGQSIDIAQVPPEVMTMIKQIDKQCAHYRPSLYAADFMNSPRGFKLVELNSRPGLQHPNWSTTYKKFNDAVVEMLVSAVQD